MLELLSPVGDFDCLKAAVQNGADSVYFGANLFSARAYAHNFDLEELQKAIQYAKIRGVKTHLTLNTLIKDDEFDDALSLAKNAYKFGIDAIIVQDLGLAKTLIKMFPDLQIHASTQMTVHNLNGALELQDMGFKRVVLSRELSTDEIDYICKNTNIEIECFAHGALCISYSGQCLFSSMIGGRSGNRGKCAQPCRLPYDLLENDKKINSGHLLSTRDLCSLEYLPALAKSGVHCLKIEGRMKSPEYVAIVTRIYKKYINLAQSNEPYIIDKNDKKELMQVFNRGMSSSGHLSNEPNKNLVFKDKPNNMGLYLGKVQNYNKNKGLITIKLKENISIGDTISIEKETGSYTVSELLEGKHNITETKIGQTVVIGRMKGNISVNDNVYKMSSKALSNLAKDSYKKENRKIFLNCKVTIKKGEPLSISILPANNLDLYKDLKIELQIDAFPTDAQNRPLDRETVIKQISKTTDSPYQFKNINVELSPNSFIPKISSLNELRRLALEEVEKFAISKCYREINENKIKNNNFMENEKNKKFIINDNNIEYMGSQNSININQLSKEKPKISLLLNTLNLDYDYSVLENVNNIYIPLKFFISKKYSNILKQLGNKFDMYIYMPTIIKGNYRNLFFTYAENSVKNYNIHGFVVSNIGTINLLNILFNNINKSFKLIGNYTFNIFNNKSVLELKKLGINTYTISPELDKSSIDTLCNYTYLKKELIIYGRTPLMNMNYCLLGESDKCYPECSAKCKTNNSYYLKDRLNMTFPIIPDNIQTVTTLYNSKITSISYKDFCIDSVRIDILEENLEQIKKIIKTVNSGNRIEGKEYTNGNMKKLP